MPSFPEGMQKLNPGKRKPPGISEIFYVVTSDEEECFGPFTSEVLAEKVLKIVQMSIDESAEIWVPLQMDPFAEELNAGLLPWKICVWLVGKEVRSTEVNLIWPPAEHDGITREQDGYMEYCFWAKTKGEAVGKLGSYKRPVPPIPEKQDSEIEAEAD